MSREFDRDYWEERHQSPAFAEGVRLPSPHLQAEVADLEPGVALDAGCGDGANTRWLAERGWTVTGVDFSPTALERARERTAELAPEEADRLTWVRADLTEWKPEQSRYDLVTSLFVHPAGSRDDLFRGLADAVAPGGTLLIMGHHPAEQFDGVYGTDSDEAFFTPEAVTALLDPADWEVDTAEAMQRTSHGSHGRPGEREHCANGSHAPHGDHGHGDGGEVSVHDTVVRARRIR
ncbi:class I SAM-dependent methyltransferase [Salininema proteolyticum]|uniref:Class I SAM-dependent methyltransferase n=1 Tax=Salininema proteolyticum TaxID=1607685 RepID=A0ABV8U1T7_9ACTN